jgi:hypothetical protein
MSHLVTLKFWQSKPPVLNLHTEKQLKLLTMRKLLLVLSGLIITGISLAQNFTFSITQPNPLPDPLAFCYGDTVTFTLQYDGWGQGKIMQCTEAPDLEGYSNADKWETLNMV